MADAAVSALVREVLRRLTSPAIQEFGLLRGLEDDVSALKVTFSQIEAVLHDAEVKQMKQDAVDKWLRSLRSASLEVENVLDEVSTEAMLRRLHIERGIKYRVRAFFSSYRNRFIVRTKIAHKVKNIRRKLDDIAANRVNFNLIPGTISADEGVGGETRSRETSSLVQFSKTYGRDAEIEMVTKKICNKGIVRHYVDDVRVYAIWGMAGVGKTTLAQLAYNHDSVKRHFELRCWVYVSTEFDIEKLTRGIIESIDGRRCKLSQLDAMQVHLQNRLRGKRFLIVLDDVWNDDRTKWDELNKALSCGAESSIVMVTTQSQKISTMMAKVPEFLHKVGCLSEEDSWSLFKMFAFGIGRKEANIRELEPIGKEIVEKCKGLPLALKTLGSLMWSKSSAIEWQRVKESEIWELQENGVDILPALELSYDNLHLPLKRCFAYCCLFPKGYEMDKDSLIELWMANGFIPSRGEAYVLGEEIFDCLIWRSFFQDVQKGNSKDRICKMHDLMHDLARYVMRHDCLVIELGNELITPDEVLHLSSSRPESIIYLQNLQVLLLQSCMELRKLPEGMRYMRNLRSLDIRNCNELQCMPVGTKKLTGLQRLSNFIVGRKSGARIGELGDLNLLGWELQLTGLHNVEGLADAKSAHLKYKRNVISLILDWSKFDGTIVPADGLEPCELAHLEEVLEGLEPNLGLKELELRCYMGKKISPSWMASFENLVKIRFWDCISCECIPPLGKLPSLRVIDIKNNVCLRSFHDDDNTSGDDILFPCLQELHISNCWHLASLPTNLTKLEILNIDGAFLSLVTSQNSGSYIFNPVGN